MSLKVKWWHLYLGGNQPLSNWIPGPFNKRKIMAGIKNLDPFTWGSEVIAVRGRPTAVTFLNQYNFKRHSKHLSLHPQVCVDCIPHQSSIFFPQLKEMFTFTITDCHNQLKRRENLIMVYPASVDTLRTQFLNSRLEGHQGRRDRKILRARVPRSLL